MPLTYRILVVDDDESIVYILKAQLAEFQDFEVDTATSGAEAMRLIQGRVFDVVLLDIRMPHVDGIEVLKYIRDTSPTTEVIILTHVVDMKTAVEATKLGAYDVVSKPYDFEQLVATVRRAIEHRQLLINRDTSETNKPLALIGNSPGFVEAKQKALKIASTESFVLIQGASGTGKELFARLIHQHSIRKHRPFIAVNCAAMPDQLLESELFGHEKGAFTSAIATKPGLVEVADGGTLFLDEVGDISLVTQPKLLRFLETGEFRRVGGTITKTVNVRVISATNKNLHDEVRAGRFREDLLYRLNVLNLRLPTLKERKEDIPLLVEHFLTQRSKTKHISKEALEMLQEYDWPGNVRELEHVIEGAITLAHGDVIEPKDLWLNYALMPQQREKGTPTQDLSWYSPLLSLKELEKAHIERVLKYHRWNRTRTAKSLGITERTLYTKIKEYKIRVPRIEDLE
ncbi:MAG: sigma-54 dependent transcriptional regulator [Bacteroidetes bacterium]|nr:sigma-54 dependent transcriptional regulator [Bacteroidota bacterium]